MRIFRRKAHIHLPDTTALDDELRCLAMMQHHGAATRLLDFSKSPFVAAFFACDEDWLTCSVVNAVLYLLGSPLTLGVLVKGLGNFLHLCASYGLGLSVYFNNVATGYLALGCYLLGLVLGAVCRKGRDWYQSSCTETVQVNRVVWAAVLV